VISSSPSDVMPVFQSVAEHAARICEAQFVDIVIVEDGMMRIGAAIGEIGGLLRSREAVTLDRTTVMGRSICDKEPVHVTDLQNAGLSSHWDGSSRSNGAIAPSLASR
jgi:hypothetical protein